MFEYHYFSCQRFIVGQKKRPTKPALRNYTKAGSARQHASLTGFHSIVNESAWRLQFAKPRSAFFQRSCGFYASVISIILD
jgi:hypothetical protein